MNKNSKHKLLAITFLLSLLSIYSMYAALIPVVQATEPNIQDKAMTVLSDVVGINTESYATNLNSQVDKEYRGLIEKEVNLYFSSEGSQLRASCTFVNNNLHLVYMSDYAGTPSLKRLSANTVDMAKGFLEEYENYAGDSFYGGLASMLNTIDVGGNNTKIVGNVKLDVLNLGNIVDFTWTYADDSGIVAQIKSVILSYESGQLKSFLNNWPLYTVTGTAKISMEEATSIAIQTSKNFSYTLKTENHTVTVSGFEISPKSLRGQRLSYLNFPDQNTARGGDPFTLYPSWYVPLGFDKFYPGDVTGMTVTIWADTGEVSSTNRMVCSIRSPSAVQEEIDSKTEQSSQKSSYSLYMLAPIVIASILGCVTGCLLSIKRYLARSGMRKLFYAKFWGMILCASVFFSLVLVMVPTANATGSDLIRGKAMIYASLYNQTDNEPDAAEEVTDYIKQCFIENGYSTANLCGAGTTRSNVMSYTQSSEDDFARVAMFHFGHFVNFYVGYYDNSGVPIYWYDIDDLTEAQKHFFVWIWACAQAYDASSYMPVAWTHREPGTGGYMSNDGYGNPDSGEHCFITFDDASPQIGG